MVIDVGDDTLDVSESGYVKSHAYKGDFFTRKLPSFADDATMCSTPMVPPYIPLANIHRFDFLLMKHSQAGRRLKEK